MPTIAEAHGLRIDLETTEDENQYLRLTDNKGRVYKIFLQEGVPQIQTIHPIAFLDEQGNSLFYLNDVIIDSGNTVISPTTHTLLPFINTGFTGDKSKKIGAGTDGGALCFELIDLG